MCAQPATLYYAWQVEVMLNNFIEMGVNPNFIDIVCWKQNGVIPEEWSKLASGYPARFFFYDDTRETKHYISSIRPNILKQHFLQHPYLKEESIFYHDSDIIFTKPIKDWITDDMINDNEWYGSDTRWYIAHSYIKSKGQDVIDKMCKIMDLPESLIEENELNSIGAQYLMKGIDYHFWNRVEIDCELLYKNITDLNTEKSIEDRRTMPPGEERTPYHPLQIWCADMWAVLWGAWKMGAQTLIEPGLEFSWGTSSLTDYNRHNIMHNAGVTSNNGGKLFYKGEFINKNPFEADFSTIDPNTASAKYVDAILYAKEKRQ